LYVRHYFRLGANYVGIECNKAVGLFHINGIELHSGRFRHWAAGFCHSKRPAIKSSVCSASRQSQMPTTSSPNTLIRYIIKVLGRIVATYKLAATNNTFLDIGRQVFAIPNTWQLSHLYVPDPYPLRLQGILPTRR